MRGTERPSKVNWSRPYLLPLQPLSPKATQKMFTDIADDIHPSDEVEKLLHLTDNVPLAVELMAHMVDSDSSSNVLAHWEAEKTTSLSKGHDKQSNLDMSIQIALNSPRIASTSGSMDLLRILAILPDGLSNVELLQSNLSIPDILSVKSVLLGTSLAYVDDNKRLKSLNPIRQHIQYVEI